MADWKDDGVDPSGGGADPEGPALLTPAGLARREAMLRLLQVEVVRVRWRRSAIRIAAIAAVPLAVAAGLWVSRGSSPPSGEAHRPIAQLRVPKPSSEVPTVQAARIEVVHDDPEVLDRFSIRKAAPIEMALIGDDELLALLAAAGRPSGLIRAGGKVILTEDPVHGSP